MTNDPQLLEKEAHALLEQERFYDAYALFKRAGDIYRGNSQHKEAALCLASAASCWSIRSGEKIFYNAAHAYRQAARESQLAGDWEYASLLYRQAAINFERDLEFLNFSECFYSSRESLRKFLTRSLFSPQKVTSISTVALEARGVKGFIKRLCLWLSLTVSFLIWGHGERPLRPLGFGVSVIVFSAFFYWQGELLRQGVAFKPTLLDAFYFYFSMVTFTTVGFGDIVAVGYVRLMVMFEMFCSLIATPLFIISLTRKYLRI